MKAELNKYPFVTLANTTSTPATPEAGTSRVFVGSDKKLWLVDSTGAVTAVATTGTSTGGTGTVTSVNTVTPASGGNVSLTADNIPDGTNYKTMTTAERTKLTGIAAGATSNATDAQLRDRATHTGSQSMDTTTDSVSRLAFTPTERTKLSGVATGATANSTDAQLRDRATHTGTQIAATISDITETIHDTVAGFVQVAGGAITKTYDDVNGILTLTVTGTGGTGTTDPEIVRDTIAAALRGGPGISVGLTTDDANDVITITCTVNWATLTGKPAVIAAGANVPEAQAAIGGGTVGRSVFTSETQSQARTALGLGTINDVIPLARVVYNAGTGAWPTRPANAVSVDYLGGVLSNPPMDWVDGVDTWTIDASQVP